MNKPTTTMITQQDYKKHTTAIHGQSSEEEDLFLIIGVQTVEDFMRAVHAHGLAGDEANPDYFVDAPLSAWAIQIDGRWSLDATSTTPGAQPAMCAAAQWLDADKQRHPTADKCSKCDVKQGTHVPVGAATKIQEPAASADKQVEEVMGLVETHRKLVIEVMDGEGSFISVQNAEEAIRAKLRALLTTPQPCSRSHPHEEMSAQCELRTEIARLTNKLARTEAELSSAQSGEQAPFGYVNTSTGQFFKDVEPCRKNNEGHWRTVYTHPTQQGLAQDAALKELIECKHKMAELIARCELAEATAAETKEHAVFYRHLRDMDWYAEPRLDAADGTVWKLTMYSPQEIVDASDDDSLDAAIRAALAAQPNGEV